MQLLINHQLQQLIPIQIFRQTWHLPDKFGLPFFEPEDRQDLGNMEQAGPALNELKDMVLQALPNKTGLDELFAEVSRLAAYFQFALETVNPQIGLRQPEIDFARSGFEDILQGAVDQLVRLGHTHRTQPELIDQQFDYDEIYQTWLNDATRVATETKQFEHNGQTFIVHIVYNPYGRIGLEVQVNGEMYYVADPRLACPAASFMKTLCQAVAQQLCQAFTTGLRDP